MVREEGVSEGEVRGRDMGLVEGEIKGREAGLVEGEERGLIKGATRIARSLLAEGMDKEQVARLTDLTPEEVAALGQEM